MRRRLSPDRDREYEELSAYLAYYYTYVRHIDRSTQAHPTNVLEYIESEYGRSRAFTGLKQAVHDTVESMVDARQEEIEKIDTALRQRGILTFSEVRRRYAAAYKRILKRGTIRTETEYYLVAGVLADVSSRADEDEKATLGRLVRQYERTELSRKERR